MGASPVFVVAFAIGVVAGLRSLTAPTTLAWGARLGWLHLQNSRLSIVGSKAVLWILTLLAILELILDTNPEMPDRTVPASLAFRVVTGGFSGAAACISLGQSAVYGAALGAVGAVTGTFAGYQVRHRIVTNLHVPDLGVAALEDLLAICGGLFLAARL
jgi:uncharacterized membrane protein